MNQQHVDPELITPITEVIEAQTQTSENLRPLSEDEVLAVAGGPIVQNRQR